MHFSSLPCMPQVSPILHSECHYNILWFLPSQSWSGQRREKFFTLLFEHYEVQNLVLSKLEDKCMSFIKTHTQEKEKIKIFYETCPDIYVCFLLLQVLLFTNKNLLSYHTAWIRLKLLLTSQPYFVLLHLLYPFDL